MFSIKRRRFLQRAAAAGVAWSTNSLLGKVLFGKPSPPNPARVIVDRERTLAKLDPRVFGSFLEHLGRAVYEGVYEPGSPLADSNGFRKDVMEEIRRLNVPIIRYPGGNFVSGYNWLDGVGPKENRPTVLEKAWNSIETNQFGTNEFIDWCRLVNTEPLLATNLGTNTPEMSAALVEYCNVEKGTRWSNLRREHGYSAPHKVKTWCLGNEMDGPWQMGHMPAREYGRKARDAARQMRMVDRSVELIACGSSGPQMQTYLQWDREMLDECYDQVDGISLHRYMRNDRFETNGDSSKFVALNLTMDRQIEEVAAVADLVRGRKRSSKTLWLSFDEWNVWYRARSGNGRRQFAPHILEEVYNLEDALLVGGMVNTLLRYADRVRIACLAQIINVIAPITTNKDGLMRHTIYYPYAWALQYAHGEVLDLAPESETYEVTGLVRTADLGQVPYLDVAGTVDREKGRVTLFMLNRDFGKEREITVVWRESAPKQVLVSKVITGSDLKAFNTFEQPNRVVPQDLDAPKVGTKMTFKLPAQSYTVVEMSTV